MKENNCILVLEPPILADRLHLGYKRGDTKVLGPSNWKMKLLGYKMGKTRKIQLCGERSRVEFWLLCLKASDIQVEMLRWLSHT